MPKFLATPSIYKSTDRLERFRVSEYNAGFAGGGNVEFCPGGNGKIRFDLWCVVHESESENYSRQVNEVSRGSQDSIEAFWS